MRKRNWNESKKILKIELKKEFPEIKFSMRKSNYNTLRISYIDSDTTEQEVRNFVLKFEGKSFDGMIDLESYIDTGLAFGYIFIEREITQKKYEEIYIENIYDKSFDGVLLDMCYNEFLELNFYSNEYENLKNWGHNPQNMIYRIMSSNSFIKIVA